MPGVDGTHEPEKRYTRRDFLKLSAKIAAAALLAACSPRQETTQNSNNTPQKPEQDTPPENGEIILTNPISLDPRVFVQNLSDYPTAISDRSPFARNEKGEPVSLRYGGTQFPEVTYLHYTGGKPPVVGEIAPVMYKLPLYPSEKNVQIAPYAISTQYKTEQFDLNDGTNHYVVPIVTTGNDSGIFKQKQNTSNKDFDVKADNFSGSNRGYLSWALLTELGNELVVVGVTRNADIYISPNNVPQEIKNLIGE